MSLAEYPQIAERCPDEETVTELVVRFRDTRDSARFGRLFERYRRMVSAHLLTLGVRDEHAREDLLQDVFLQALRKIDDLKEPAAFGSWVRSIATRMNINRTLRTRRHVSIFPEKEDTEMLHADRRQSAADVEAIRCERAAKVLRCMRLLKPMDRSMLQQFYFEHLSLNDMSALTEPPTPVGTIKRRLHTARKRLGELLGEYGIVDAGL